jgi:signal transduction histidine kinase
VTWVLVRWRRWAGVRVQAALIAALTVGLALAAGSGLFVLVLDRNLVHDVDVTLKQQSRTLAAGVARSGPQLDLQARLGDTNAVQVLDASGAVVASSPELRGQPPLTTAHPAAGQSVLSSQHLDIDPDADYRQAALGVEGPTGERYTVVVAQSLEVAERSTKVVKGLLLLGSPVLLLLVALVTYRMSGRALRPVEAMRRRVAAIDGRSLDSRVELPDARDEVHRLAGTMNLMLERLEGASRAQRQFVSDASHELRSPLATVRTSIEVAQAHPEGADWQATAQVVLEEAGRVERLVADLLLLAQTDERGLQLRRTDVDLDDLVEAEALRVRATTSLRVTSSVQAVRVRGDRDRLARVLRNLVDNAARHAHEQVTLSLRTDDGRAVLEVEDDGAGVVEQDRGRVFQRFVRLDDSRSRSEGGTGLGLAIVHELVQAHGGDVGFVEAARIRVRLPLPDSAVAQSAPGRMDR